MSEKVKITRKQADALNHYRIQEMSNLDIIQVAINVELGTLSSNKKAMYSMEFNTLLQALVNGYEIEETPEDKVRGYYKNLRSSCNWSATGAIENVLEMLNIKISGVNAE